MLPAVAVTARSGYSVYASWRDSGGARARRGPMPRRIPTSCARIVQADVVAIDQCLVINRFGTAIPNGMIFALRRDIVSNTDPPKEDLQPGDVVLREGKRPRPIVLRVNEGDCLEIRFTNLLDPKPNPVTGDPGRLLRPWPHARRACMSRASRSSRISTTTARGWRRTRPGRPGRRRANRSPISSSPARRASITSPARRR